MKKNRFIVLLLIMTMVISVVQPATTTVTAKTTKYTKTERKLSQTLADFQDSELLDPDSFKIRHIYRVKYALKKKYYESYREYKILGAYKTIKWEVEYSAKNAFGGTVRDTVYVSSTYNYTDEDGMDFDEYTDKTDVMKKYPSKKYLERIRALTKKYYNEY